jgi:hypothetical protein
LGYGDGPVAAVLLIVALLLLTMVAVSGRNTANSVVGLPIEAEAAPSTP